MKYLKTYENHKDDTPEEDFEFIESFFEEKQDDFGQVVFEPKIKFGR